MFILVICKNSSRTSPPIARIKSAAKKKARLIFSHLDSSLKVPPLTENTFSYEGRDYQSHANVFSSKSIDIAIIQPNIDAWSQYKFRLSNMCSYLVQNNQEQDFYVIHLNHKMLNFSL